MTSQGTEQLPGTVFCFPERPLFNQLESVIFILVKALLLLMFGKVVLILPSRFQVG